MRSMLRRSRGLVAAGVIMALGLGTPPLASRALALAPNIPYVDKDQDSDQAPGAWLLMAPPTTNSGLTVDTQAGLAQWLTYGRYNRLQDCTTTIQLVRNGAVSGSTLPAQVPGGAISPGAIPGSPGYQPMQPGYGGMQPGYPGAQAAYPPMQPGYQGIQPGYGGMQPSYPGAQAAYPPMQPGYQGMQPGYQGMQPGYQGMQPGYQGMQPGYQGMQPGYQGMQPGYQGMQPGYSGMQPGYGSNQPIIQQPAQLMTRQQTDAAYCFAENDRRLHGLIAPPPAAIPPGQQPLSDMPGGMDQRFPGAGQ